MKTAVTVPATEHHESILRRLEYAVALVLLTLLTAGGLWIALSWTTASVPPDKMAWYIIRAAGLMAYGLLWLSVVFGLMVSMGLFKQANAQLVGMHEFLSLMSLVFTLLHAVSLHFDPWLQASWSQIWVPLAMTSYRPLAVALGQVGFYLLASVVISFYVRRRIGAKRWRMLHYFTFALYGLVLVHAVTAGTDSRLLGVQRIYFITAGTVLFLSAMRIVLVSNR